MYCIVLVGVVTGFQCLTSVGVQFNAAFLCHLLSVLGPSCTGSGRGSIQWGFLKAVLDGLEKLRFQLTVGDYTHIIRTMTDLKMFNE